MQDLEPELQELWEDAGWSVQREDAVWSVQRLGECLEEDEQADNLLAELVQQIEEVKSEWEYQHAMGQEGLEESDDIGDIWLAAGWKLPESCIGVPWYDCCDSAELDEIEIDSPRSFVRQQSQAYQFDPPETLREVARGGSMLRQVSSVGDKYVKTEESSTMLRQISSAMKRQMSEGTGLQRQLSEGTGLQRQVSIPSNGDAEVIMPRRRTYSEGGAAAMARRVNFRSKESVISSPSETTATPRLSPETMVADQDMQPQLSGDTMKGQESPTKRQESLQIKEGVSPRKKGSAVSFMEGYVESLAPTQQLSANGTCGEITLPYQGVLATTASVGAISAGFTPLKEDEAVSGARLDYAMATVLDVARSECADRCQRTCFHAKRAPSISLLDYVTRIRRYLHCSDEVLILSLVFMNRMTTLNPPMEVGQQSCHRLLITSVLVSMKYYDDVFPGNKYSSCVFGISLGELNSLEAEFVRLLDWHLYVDIPEYKWFLENLSQIGCHYVSQPETTETPQAPSAGS